MKKIIFVFCGILILLAGSVFTAYAGDFCNIDNYGCWVEEDGQKIYTMFWSEESRKFFMGGMTEPYTNVTELCSTCGDQLPMEGAGSSSLMSLTDMMRQAVISHQVQWILNNIPGTTYNDVIQNVTNHVNSMTDEELLEAYNNTKK